MRPGWTASPLDPQYRRLKIGAQLGTIKHAEADGESWASRISYFSTSLLRVSNCAGLHGLNGKLHTDSARCIVIDHLSKEKRIWKRLETALSKSDAELLSLNNSAIVPRLRGVHEYSEGATIPKHPQLGRGKADRERSVLGHDSAGASGS